MLTLISTAAWSWFKTPFGNLAIGIGVMFVLWQADRAGQRRVGEVRSIEKIERATTNATEIGKRAAAKSLSGGVRGGQIDPSTRDR